VKRLSGESGGAAVVVGDGGVVVVVVVEAVWFVVGALVELGAALVAGDLASPLEGEVVQPVTSPAATTRATATRRIPIPQSHPRSESVHAWFS
jgi:hypothetical protein